MAKGTVFDVMARGPASYQVYATALFLAATNVRGSIRGTIFFESS